MAAAQDDVFWSMEEFRTSLPGGRARYETTRYYFVDPFGPDGRLKNLVLTRITVEVVPAARSA